MEGSEGEGRDGGREGKRERWRDGGKEEWRKSMHATSGQSAKVRIPTQPRKQDVGCKWVGEVRKLGNKRKKLLNIYETRRVKSSQASSSF